MPFDATPTKQDSEVVTVLKKARALIDSPEKIVCDTFATHDGHCTYAAIFAASGAAPKKYYDKRVLGPANVFADANFIPRLEGQSLRHAIAMWHDDLAHTRAVDAAQFCNWIVAAFDNAIQLAESIHA